jgi:hypothetical protein
VDRIQELERSVDRLVEQQQASNGRLVAAEEGTSKVRIVDMLMHCVGAGMLMRCVGIHCTHYTLYPPYMYSLQAVLMHCTHHTIRITLGEDAAGGGGRTEAAD